MQQVRIARLLLEVTCSVVRGVARVEMDLRGFLLYSGSRFTLFDLLRRWERGNVLVDLAGTGARLILGMYRYSHMHVLTESRFKAGNRYETYWYQCNAQVAISTKHSRPTDS